MSYDPRAGAYVGGDDFGVAAGAPPPMSADELETLVRFEHPAKLLSVAELPGAAGLSEAALAEAYATDAGSVAALRASLRSRVRAAAREVVAAPVPAGSTIVALGDSITDDALSWAEILRECVSPDVTVVNAGVSGDTTADAWRRLYGITLLEPDLVIAMLGTNDCQRHGPGGELLVAPEESARNLASIAGWLRRAGARRLWITPPPVDEDALARAVGSRPFAVRDADVRAVAAAIHGLGDPVVDLHEVFAGRPGLLMEDGVHPTLEGQTAIAAAVASELGHSHSGTGNP
jgi:lysophospholipase L1-like esterase